MQIQNFLHKIQLKLRPLKKQKVKFNDFLGFDKNKKSTKILLGLMLIFFIAGALIRGNNLEKITVNINSISIEAEVAATPQQHRQGLMYRSKLAKNAGMLFIFDFEGNHTFWMKNTFIPLDIIWINENKDIVHIENSAPPCSSEPCLSYRSNKPARYVLEVSGGWAISNGVKLGDKVDF